MAFCIHYVVKRFVLVCVVPMGQTLCDPLIDKIIIMMIIIMIDNLRVSIMRFSFPRCSSGPPSASQPRRCSEVARRPSHSP